MAEKQDTQAAYELYLKGFPHGRFVKLARERIRAKLDEAQENALWEKTTRRSTRKAYLAYLSRSKLRHHEKSAQRWLEENPGGERSFSFGKAGLTAAFAVAGIALYASNKPGPKPEPVVDRPIAQLSQPAPAQVVPAVVSPSEPAAETVLANWHRPVAERLKAYRGLPAAVQKENLDRYLKIRSKFRETGWWRLEDEKAPPDGAEWLADVELFSDAGNLWATVDLAWVTLYGLGRPAQPGKAAELYRRALQMAEVENLPKASQENLKKLLADADTEVRNANSAK